MKSGLSGDRPTEAADISNSRHVFENGEVGKLIGGV